MGEFASIANFVYNTYVVPAFLNDREKVTIRVHEVLRGLEGAYGLVAIHRVLCSEKFLASIALQRNPDSGSLGSESYLPSEYTFDLKPLLSQRSKHPAGAGGAGEIKSAAKPAPELPRAPKMGAVAPRHTPKSSK